MANPRMSGAMLEYDNANAGVLAHSREQRHWKPTDDAQVGKLRIQRSPSETTKLRVSLVHPSRCLVQEFAQKEDEK